MAIDGITITQEQFTAFQNDVVQAGSVNLTLSSNDGSALAPEEFYIQNATEVSTNVWQGGNVTSGVTSVEFVVDGLNVVAIVSYDQFTVGASPVNFHIDIDREKPIDQVIPVAYCGNPGASNYYGETLPPGGYYDEEVCTFEPVYFCNDPNAINVANPFPIYGIPDNSLCIYEDKETDEEIEIEEVEEDLGYFPTLKIYLSDGMSDNYDPNNPNTNPEKNIFTDSDNYTITITGAEGSARIHGGFSASPPLNLYPGGGGQVFEQPELFQDLAINNSIAGSDFSNDIVCSLDPHYRATGSINNGYNLQWLNWIDGGATHFYTVTYTAKEGYVFDNGIQSQTFYYDFEEPKDYPTSWSTQTNVLEEGPDGTMTKFEVLIFFQEITGFYPGVDLASQQEFVASAFNPGNIPFGPVDEIQSSSGYVGIDAPAKNNITSNYGGGPMIILKTEARSIANLLPTVKSATISSSTYVNSTSNYRKSQIELSITGERGAQFIVRAKDSNGRNFNQAFISNDIEDGVLPIDEYIEKGLTDEWTNRVDDSYFTMTSSRAIISIPTIAEEGGGLNSYTVFLEPFGDTEFEEEVPTRDNPVSCREISNVSGSFDIVNTNTSLTATLTTDKSGNAVELPVNRSLGRGLNDSNVINFIIELSVSSGVISSKHDNENFTDGDFDIIYYKDLNGNFIAADEGSYEVMLYGKIITYADRTKATIEGSLFFTRTEDGDLKLELDIDKIIDVT